MADLTKNLLVKLTGDSKSAQSAMLEFDAAVAKSQQATANLAVKVQEDFKKMEVAAATAAESIKKIGADSAGAGGGGLGGLFAGFTVTAGDIQNAAQSVVQFGESAVHSFTSAADSVRLFSQLTGASAEESSRWINAGQLLGVSADTMNTAFGKFGSTVEQNKTKLEEHGVVLAHNKDGSIDLTGTLRSIQAAFQSTTDATEKDTVAKLVAGRGYKELEEILNLTTDQMNRLLEAAGKGPMFNKQDLADALAIKERLGEIQLSVDKLKVAAGERILGDLSGAAAGLQKIDDILQHMDNLVPHFSQGWKTWIEGAAKVAPLLGPVANLFDLAKSTEQGLNKLGDSANHAAGGFGELKPEIDTTSSSLDQVGKQATISEGKIQSLTAAMRSAESAWSQFQSANDYSSNASDKFAKSLEALDTAQSKAGGAASNLADAQEAAAQRIADSQQRIVDAKQKVVDAEENLADVTASAEQRMQDAQEAASRSAESAADRVQTAKQHLADTINASLANSNPYAAQRSVDDARAGLAKAEEDQQRTLGDNAKTLSRDREAADKQVENAKKGIVTATQAEVKSEQDLEKTLREVEKSMRAAGGAADTANQSLGQQEGLIDNVVKATGNQVFAQALQKQSLDQLNGTVDQAIAKVQQEGEKWGWSKDQVQGYIDKLKEIPKNVTTTLGLTVDLYGFERQVDAAMKFFANPNDPLTRAGVEAAAANPGGQALPVFASGGVVPGSVGDPVLAIVHGGEQVLTPEQRAAGSGGATVVINNYAPVWNDYEFAEFIRKAVDKGFAGIRS